MILRYLGRKDWAMVTLCVLFVLAQVYLDLRIPEYMNTITNNIQMGAGTDIISHNGVEMLTCAFLSLASSLSAGALAARISASLSRNVRDQLFDRVQSFSRQDIDSFSAASLITRSTNDVYHVQMFVAKGLQIFVKAPIMAVWATSKINDGSFEWTVTTAAAMIVLVIVMVTLMHANFPYLKKVQWLMDGINRSVRENLVGVRVIRANNAEADMQSKFDTSNADLLENNLKSVRLMSPIHPISSSMMNFLTLAIYWIGAGLVNESTSQAQQMSLFSDMIVFSSYATQIVMSVMMLTAIIRGLPRAMVSVGRIEEILDHAPSVSDGPGIDDGVSGGSVEFEHVSFSYGGEEVLHDISFAVDPGSTFAIVGTTGSGKSTLVSLIPRIYDTTSGTVSVDGHDVREYRLEDLRSRIGFVPQNAVIFSGSVSYNVSFGKDSDDETDGEVRKALETAQASSFVDSMQNGTDAMISQYGRNLSGGQKQRIGIARALCRGAEIYIFDDSFSALDYRTDHDLRSSLDRTVGNSTRIIVAQRIGTIMDSDRILVLDGGRVVGCGTHDELMTSCPLYREMAEAQLEVS